MNIEPSAGAQYLELLKKMLFGNYQRAERSFRSQAGPIVYICAIQRLEPLGIYNTIADTPSLRSYLINSDYLTAIYIEFHDNWLLFYCPPNSKINLGVDTFNQSLDSVAIQELTAFGKLHDIKNLKELQFDIFVAMYETYYELIRHTFLLNEYQLNRIKLINTYKKFYKNYIDLDAGIPIDATTHVGAFSWNYYFEIQAIKRMIGELSSIEIHDVATNTGNLPLLLSQLADSKLLPFKLNSICCSDYNEKTPAEIFSTLQESLGKFNQPISVERIDLWDPKPSLLNADVIIANDILEHFTDTDSEAIFHILWTNTKNILIIHVPIEDTPNRFYGHFTNFTDDRLFAWASKLPNCENLTPKIMETVCHDANYDKSGFLFLKRKTPLNV